MHAVDARSNCKVRGGHLAVIRDAEHNALVQKIGQG